MKRIIRFNEGIIDGDDMRDICKILPELSSMFKTRKNYDEYYFTEVEIEITLEKINRLSDEYYIQMNYEMIKIMV